jgi:hypothetical protein
MSETVILKRILSYLEVHLQTPISIDVLAAEFGIPRRSVSDFVTICSTWRICQRMTHNCVEWLGIDQALPVLKALRQEVQDETADRGLCELFNYSIDSSLQRMALAVVKVFFFLGVKFLDVRKVSRIFAQRNAKYKTILRKLYTVSSVLEVAGIVRRTAMVSEIQLIVTFDAENEMPRLGLRSILNTKEELETEILYERRRREFDAACLELALPASARGIQKQPPFPHLTPPFAAFP